MVMKTYSRLFLLILCLSLLVDWAAGQQKLAQTGMKFLAVGTDARGVALAEALTATEGYSSSMFYNPANMARLSGFANVMVGQTRWIADIKHNFGSVAFSPFDGEYGVLGFFLQAVDYGEIEGTIAYPNEQGYLDIGTFKPTALAMGVGYARALSDKFSVGGNVKYVTQDLGNAVVAADTFGNMVNAGNKTNVVAFDFGILYRTGFKSLNFGMTVRNFSREIRYVKDGFQLPLTFKIGLSMNILDLWGMDRETHEFLLAVDAEHPRDYPEQIRIGGEYVFLKHFALRAGYVTPTDEQGISLGFGLKQVGIDNFRLGIDYAYTAFGIFDNVHRLSFQFSL
jgi:hypothetical protein